MDHRAVVLVCSYRAMCRGDLCKGQGCCLWFCKEECSVLLKEERLSVLLESNHELYAMWSMKVSLSS